jgi:ribonuclease PH
MKAKTVRDALKAQVAAVSLGVLDGGVLTDLCYEEDKRAETDLNLVARSDGGIVEVQGTAEGAPLHRKELDLLVDQGLVAIDRLCALQREALGEIWR